MQKEGHWSIKIKKKISDSNLYTPEKWHPMFPNWQSALSFIKTDIWIGK